MNAHHRNTAVCLCAVLCAAILGCVASRSTPKVKDGKNYGDVNIHRGQWWNLYERGLSYSDGEFWEDAVKDLNGAIRQRGKDGRRSRTYGMHFIDYFPHREKGIALHSTGDYEAAIQELETSLSQEPSAKARYFLDQARTLKLQKTGADAAAPAIHWAEPEGGYATSEAFFKIEAKIKDDQYVGKVFLNGKQIHLASAQEVTVSEQILLDEGQNKVTLVAEDLTGKKISSEKIILADWQGPMMGVSIQEKDKKLLLVGTAEDPSGLSRLSVGEKNLSVVGQRVDISEPIGHGLASVLVVAVDKVGNVTYGTVDIPDRSRAERPIILASLGSFVPSVGMATSPTLSSVEIEGPKDGQRVYMNRIRLTGKARSTSSIKKVTINGQNVGVLAGNKADQIFFSRIVPLSVEGENAFLIHGEDEAGNPIEDRQLTVIRRTPTSVNVGSRATLAVLPASGSDDEPLQERVFEGLQAEILHTERFVVIDRLNTGEIIDELNIGSSNLASPDSALSLGKIVPASYFVFTGLDVTPKGVELTSSFVDSETGTVLEAVDAFSPSTVDQQLLRFKCEELAVGLSQVIPLACGKVVKIQGDQLVTDVGVMDGVKEGMRLIVYRKGEELVDDKSGESFGAFDEEVALMQVSKVIEKASMGKVISKKSEIKDTDLIIAR